MARSGQRAQQRGADPPSFGHRVFCRVGSEPHVGHGPSSKAEPTLPMPRRLLPHRVGRPRSPPKSPSLAELRSSKLHEPSPDLANGSPNLVNAGSNVVEPSLDEPTTDSVEGGQILHQPNFGRARCRFWSKPSQLGPKWAHIWSGHAPQTSRDFIGTQFVSTPAHTWTSQAQIWSRPAHVRTKSALGWSTPARVWSNPRRSGVGALREVVGPMVGSQARGWAVHGFVPASAQHGQRRCGRQAGARAPHACDRQRPQAPASRLARAHARARAGRGRRAACAPGGSVAAWGSDTLR